MGLMSGINLEGMGSGALNFAIIIFVMMVIGAVLILATKIYLKWKQYNEYSITIWKVDKYGQRTESYDSAGVFIDPKTKIKRLFLRRNNVGLNPDNIPFTSAGSKKVVHLLQTGLKNFHYINLHIENPKVTLSVGEEDVNWAINDYERQKSLFDTNKFLQYMPYIAIAFVSIIILITFIYFFKDFDVLKDTAIALREAAQAISQANSGTTVIS